MGILVVSDMGLSSFNSDLSRSNIPNHAIPKVPGYRPPECDVKGGTISRAYDIWTLGCLFLELITWLLGGAKYLEQFNTERKSIYINGAVNNIFFVLKQLKQGNGRVAQVKKQVTEVRFLFLQEKEMQLIVSSGLINYTIIMIVLNLYMIPLTLSRTTCLLFCPRKEKDSCRVNCERSSTISTQIVWIVS